MALHFWEGHLEGCEQNFSVSLVGTSLTRCLRVGQLGAGAVTNVERDGWRNIFWMQAAFQLATAVMLLVFYYPPRRSDYPTLKLSEFLWSLDPIGVVLFVGGATLVLLALDWTGGTYAWSDAHVAAPLGIGLGLLVIFCLYGRIHPHNSTSRN